MFDLPPALCRWQQHYRRLPGETRADRFGCGIIVHPPGQPGRVNFHRPDAFTLVWLLQGAGDYEDTSGLRFRIQAGEAFLRLPDRCHSSRADAEAGVWIEFFVHLPVESYTALRCCGPLASAPVHWHLGFPSSLSRAARALLAAMPDEAGIDIPHCHLLLLDFIHQAWRVHEARSGDGQQVSLITQAAARLRSHLDRTLSIEALANELGLGFEHLRKLFRSHLGQSPAAYRRQHRMEHAELLLTEPDLAIADIATAVGYGDLFAFSKAFKQHSGSSPRAWRLAAATRRRKSGGEEPIPAR
jgi:AraC-like DNA-binding protein